MNQVELGVKAFWLLIGAGVLSGIVSVWAFRRWSDPRKLRDAFNRIVAHLFELRLFAEEPVLVLRAQLDLLAANGALLRQVTGPSLLLVLPFAILFVGMDAIFGRAPLQPGKPAIVTVQCSPSLRSGLPYARLDAPEGINVETPPVRIAATSQISWRLRPVRATAGELEIHCDGRLIRKKISSAPGLQWLSDSRAGSVRTFLLHPLELPFSGAPIDLISIRYAPAVIFRLNWLVWFSVSSVFAALISVRMF